MQWQAYTCRHKRFGHSIHLTGETKKLSFKLDKLGEEVIQNGKAFHSFGPGKSIVNMCAISKFPRIMEDDQIRNITGTAHTIVVFVLSKIERVRVIKMLTVLNAALEVCVV